jgi:hypothetical protein
MGRCMFSGCDRPVEGRYRYCDEHLKEIGLVDYKILLAPMDDNEERNINAAPMSENRTGGCVKILLFIGFLAIAIAGVYYFFNH